MLNNIEHSPDTLYRLQGQALIEASGPDVERFLQGQFTCDVARQSVGTSQLGACCNNKGRMIALFRLLRVDPNRYLLRLPRETGEVLIEHLRKFQVFFKCEMSLLNDSAVWGRFLDGESLPTGIDGCHSVAIEHTDLPREELWLPHADSGTNVSAHATRADSDNAWWAAEFQEGRARVSPATSGLFIPQTLNLGTLGGISFQKGCYTGQEIVARTHYLGKLKKVLRLLESATPSPDPATLPGTAVYLNGTKAGEIADATPGARGTLILAVTGLEDHFYTLDPAQTLPLENLKQFPAETS